jgi:phosphoribosyl-ATP pyrophosphohydrolase/phosphoribosyl-AMP cyclohydrolase
MSSNARVLAPTDLDTLDFAKGAGLVPAIVQHADSGAVLMLGYMNREALASTFERGRVVFFSRSRQRLWEKGETSDHSLTLKQIHLDCDADTLLVTALPTGPVCHTGTLTCFGDGPVTAAESLAFLGDLERVIDERIAARPAGSYSARLLAEGPKRIAQKVGEEGLEVALAAAAGSDAEVIVEVSDLVYHVLLMLRSRGLSLAQVAVELRARHAHKALNARTRTDNSSNE